MTCTAHPTSAAPATRRYVGGLLSEPRTRLSVAGAVRHCTRLALAVAIEPRRSSFVSDREYSSCVRHLVRVTWPSFLAKHRSPFDMELLLAEARRDVDRFIAASERDPLS